MEPKLNKWLKVFFKPKNPVSRNKRYIPCGVYTLKNHIGENNAKVAITKAMKSKKDKYTYKFRTKGMVIFYMT